MRKSITKAIAPVVVIGVICATASGAHATDPSNTCPSYVLACPSFGGCTYKEYPVGEIHEIICCTTENDGTNAAQVDVQDISCVYARNTTSSPGLHLYQCQDGDHITNSRRTSTVWYGNDDRCPPRAAPPANPNPPMIASLGAVHPRTTS